MDHYPFFQQRTQLSLWNMKTSGQHFNIRKPSNMEGLHLAACWVQLVGNSLALSIRTWLGRKLQRVGAHPDEHMGWVSPASDIGEPVFHLVVWSLIRSGTTQAPSVGSLPDDSVVLWAYDWCIPLLSMSKMHNLELLSRRSHRHRTPYLLT